MLAESDGCVLNMRYNRLTAKETTAGIIPPSPPTSKQPSSKEPRKTGARQTAPPLPLHWRRYQQIKRTATISKRMKKWTAAPPRGGKEEEGKEDAWTDGPRFGYFMHESYVCV